jgi:hypothetical protein
VIQAPNGTEDAQDDLDYEGPEAFLPKIGWLYENILAFYRQSPGSMLWECYLNTLRLAYGTDLIWCYQDFEPCRQGIPLVKHSSNAAVPSAFIKALIKKNYGA